MIEILFLLYDKNKNQIGNAIAKISIDGNPGESFTGLIAGNTFYYDAKYTKSFVFDLSSKGLTKGSHTITVQLDDGIV